MYLYIEQVRARMEFVKLQRWRNEVFEGLGNRDEMDKGSNSLMPIKRPPVNLILFHYDQLALYLTPI